MPHRPASRSYFFLTSMWIFSGCMALPFLIPPLVEFGANLLKTAFNNYGNSHEQNMENLLVALQQRTNPLHPQGMIAGSLGQSGGFQHTGFPGPQEYPQQGYVLDQHQQTPYGGNSPYPNHQYSNNSQPGDPYSTNPVYPNHHPSVPGYSSSPQNQYSQEGQQLYSYPNAQNAHPPQQNSYPNQAPYPNQPSYPDKGVLYPDPSPYAMNQQGLSYTAPEANAGMAPYPAYPAQSEESPAYQNMHVGTAPSAAAPISLDVLLVKKHMVNGVQSYLPVKDGDILRDGQGNPQAGDKFRVMFRANTDCYVYVIAVDGSAWAQGLFPPASNPFANPVTAGEKQVFPDGSNWFSLDQFKGIETLFFVASHARRQDIEQILTTITGRERHPSDTPQAVSEPPIIPNGYAGARPGSSPFAFQASLNQQQEFLPTTYFVKTVGEDLRITRWFRHQ